MNDYRKHSAISIVRSVVLVLLSLIVLIASVVAWFAVNNSVKATGLTVSVDTGASGLRITDDIGNQITENINIVLPCATKIDDVDISKEDFANAIFVKVFRVYYSDTARNINVTASVKPNNLHYYFDTTHNGDEEYAGLLKGESSANYRDKINNGDTANEGKIIVSSSDPIDTNNERYHTFAIVYYADYDEFQTPEELSGLKFNLAY